MRNVNFCCAVLVAATAVLAAPQNASAPVSIEELMSASEFRQAGLAKLSPQELAALNRWLGKYAMAVASSVQKVDTAPGAPQVIENNIEGEFQGWDGETIFKLDNGQIWQQASYAYTYHYAYRPKVVIFRSGGTYRMRVDGTTGDIAVKRLK
jgi:hypothetical protein